MNRKDKFKEEHIEVLELYIELEITKFSRKKKDIYAEIQKRTKKNLNTIISWIQRYLKEYKEIRKEIIEQKNAKICNFKGLTEKQTKYILLRMSGIGQEEAKIQAGYSEKTKAANIERSPKVATKLLELREKLFNDARFGAMASLNYLDKVKNKSYDGYDVVEYIDESSPDGHTISKKVKQEKNYIAGVAAQREINSILGYKFTDELKMQKTVTNDEAISISDEDFK
ncbi:hypothetical protein [Fusobacterium gastrosuis]|uniref:hypothetical protein n=1 Tax=Fusobacterium gastrosuis TaxID=1755100 RepID=UPI002970639B|nr:hypothetical protein [Fusobacteriaceae bacterium]MDY5713651.1 hypothetical protein [Fusobacterium gastrosuis]